jgi:hypothetical protein
MKYKFEDKKCIQTFDKSGGQRSLGRFRHGQKNNTIIYLNELKCEDVNWIQVTQDRNLENKLSIYVFIQIASNSVISG